jgi:integrase
MSVFRYKGSKVWTMDFFSNGQRIRESTGTRSKTLAQKIEDKRRRDLEEGAAGIKKRQPPRLFSVAADAWMEIKKADADLAPKTIVIEQTNLKHLKPVLGRLLVSDITAGDIAKYKTLRLEEGASRKTVNLELGTLRSILGPRAWTNLREETKAVGSKILFTIRHEDDETGRALSAEEESALMLECGRSRSRILLPFVSLALATGARYNVIRTLRWSRIDFAGRCLRFGKDKTDAGTGREVPLNQRALATLTFWAQQFPNRKPGDYVFPSEKCGGAGREDSFGFSSGAKIYDSDPSVPVGDIKEAWEAARKRTRRHCPQCKTGILADKEKSEKGYLCLECHFETPELPTGLIGIRFHDIRHTAVSRMIAAGVPLPLIGRIVGWAPSTLAKMAARYGHWGTEQLRGAVGVLDSTPKGDFEAASPVFSPVSEGKNGSKLTN